MLNATYPFYLANRPVAPNYDLEVRDKYTGEIATRVAQADADAIDRGIAAAVRAEPAMAALPAYRRQEILTHCVQRFRERADELAMALCVEAGKPIKDSRGEVSRLIDTFRIASEEAVRIYGEVIPMDISARAAGYFGMWRRVPIGACSFISPFNFPLNLAAHKIAAGKPHAGGRAYPWRSACRNGASRRRVQHPAVPARGGWPVYRRRAPQTPQLHGIGRGWLESQIQGRQEESGSGTRGQCRVHCRCRRRY